MRLIDVTPSYRTKLSIVIAISPRLLDPKVKLDKIKGAFRYSEEQCIVEDALKHRSQSMTMNIFKKVDTVSSPLAGRGGRGGGRGRGAFFSSPS